MENEIEPTQQPKPVQAEVKGGKKVIKTSTGLIIILAAVVLFFGGALAYWYYTDPNSYDNSKDATVVATKSNSNTNTTNANVNANANLNKNANSNNSNSTASTSITYTNSTYGFTLTLPAIWSTYKVKAANIEGSVATYYFQLPTSDSLYQTASSTNDAGYSSVFVVGVMNKAEWTGDELQQRDFGSKIAENASYVFTYSSAQAQPSEAIFTTARSQIQTIIATFTLN